jgi:hypothetical protein
MVLVYKLLGASASSILRVQMLLLVLLMNLMERKLMTRSGMLEELRRNLKERLI